MKHLRCDNTISIAERKSERTDILAIGDPEIRRPSCINIAAS